MKPMYLILSRKRRKKSCPWQYIKMIDAISAIIDMAAAIVFADIMVVGLVPPGPKGDCNKRNFPFAGVYWTYRRGRKTKKFTVDNTCIGCGLCERQCPVSAIKLENKKPVWVKERCTLCLGCLHRCPQFSIQYGKNTKKHGQYVNPNIKL